jgi:peptide/nickel transport system substrate-binding protein
MRNEPRRYRHEFQTGPNQVTFQLNKSYSSIWFTYNQLGELKPMPTAWDVTSLGAKPGTGGCTKLSSFSTTGNVTIVPNKAYSGSPKPKLPAVKFVPYTADSAEYTALKTGELDVG